MKRPVQRLITRDPATGDELIVTRLESPATGIIIEGSFGLGWMGRLTPEQLDFVGVFMRARGNLQKVADDFGVAYNTAKARLDEVDVALGEPEEDSTGRRQEILERLAARDIDFDEAMELLGSL
jgi:hypothetical protein